MLSRNWYNDIARNLRFTLKVVSIDSWNLSFSNIAATGNRPPSGVKFLSSKSKVVFALILLGCKGLSDRPFKMVELPVPIG
jgi:hypothetical protein